MSRAAVVASNVTRLATPEMTDKHIFALLAYEDKPGTREKFDRQFGEGAAARVLAEVQRPQEQITVTADLTEMHAKMRALQEQIADVQRLAESKADPEPEDDETEAETDDVEVEEEKPDADELALAELTQSVEARFSAMARMVEDLKTVIAAKTAEIERRVAAVPAPKPVKVTRQMRVTQRDVNDNIIAVEIIEEPTRA